MTVGIVAEYNPFHNGHEYQINKAKELTGADTVVVVMSGSFVQRGEPALCSKWARAEMALSCGADLVVELPVCFAVRSAEFFARGAVKILNALNVDNIAFGSETENVDRLARIAEVLSDQSFDNSTKIKQYLSEGISYPFAVAKAYPEFADALITPNNVLGIEYIKAGGKNPVAIQRIGVNHDGGANGDHASASYIRVNLHFAEKYMPQSAYKILQREISTGACSPSDDRLSDIILSRLRGESPEVLKKICDVSEGLENRIISSAKTVTHLEELYNVVKTKRFTHARIQRIMMNYALGITKEFERCEPTYVRVLGSNTKGFAVLKDCRLPVITKTAGLEDRIFEREVYATDLYSLLFNDREAGVGGKDFTTSPVIF